MPKFAKMAPEVLHVQFKPYPPTPSFEAPLVEVLIATLKAHATKEEFEAAMAAATNVKPKVANASSGIALEDERKYIVVEGWESLEKVGLINIHLYLANLSSSKGARNVKQRGRAGGLW